MKDLADGTSDLRPGYGSFNKYSIPLPTEQAVVDTGPGPDIPPFREWLMPSRPSEIFNAKTAVPNSVYLVWSGGDYDEERVLVALFFSSDNAQEICGDGDQEVFLRAGTLPFPAAYCLVESG